MATYTIISSGQRIVADEGFMRAKYAENEYELVVEGSTTHKEEFTPEELLNSFTSSESFAALGSSNPAVKTQAELLGLRRNITISKDDAGYITSIEDLRSEGILDNDTADSYLLGIPVERLQ